MKSEKEIRDRIKLLYELEERETKSINFDINNHKMSLLDIKFDRLSALQTEILVLEWVLR